MRKLILLAGLFVPAFARADVLFDQEPDPDTAASESAGISTNGTQNLQYALGDNFTLSSNSNVTQIGFWGGSEGSVTTDLSNFASFDIEIYSFDFSQTLYSANVTTASLNPTLTGGSVTDSFLGTTAPQYYFQLDTNLSLAAGQYWLAVGTVNINPFGDAFEWSAMTSDGLYCYNAFDQTGWHSASDTTDPDEDQAFKLSGTAAPEPASMTALVLGGLALIRRRRR